MPLKKAKPNSINCRPRVAKKRVNRTFDGALSNSGACRWLELIKTSLVVVSIIKTLLELLPK